MPGIANPMDAFLTLQEAIDSGGVELQPCKLHRDIHVLVDYPNNELRITYLKMSAGRVQAIAQFCQAEPMRGTPCFSAGVAVDEELRGQGLGTLVVSKGLEELRHGLNGAGVGDYFVEAVVSTSNNASNRLAKRLFSEPIAQDTDFFSGEPAFQYLKLFPGVRKQHQPEKRTAGTEQPQQPSRSVGRNDPCWCGSGKKFKKCHGV
jgi:hypothetical protein